jgi:hypothetical protein
MLVLALYVLTAAPTITERFGGVDGGELAATALSGGVPHPSGYPTYMLLARAALRVFPGEPAYRLALLSAVAMACAAACTSLVLLQLVPRNGRAVVGAIFAGLLLGWSPRAWSQAIIAEVYAVHMLFLSFTSLLVLRWARTSRASMFVAALGMIGLGTGAHLTILATVIGIITLIVAGRRTVGVRAVGCGILAFVAGCAIYALLPLWAARDAVPSWGDTETWSGFWAHAGGAEYRYLVGIVPWSQRLGRLGFAARDLVTQIGIAGCALALWRGVGFGWNLDRSAMAYLICVALISLVFAVGYGAADGEVYLLPWIWCWCLWAGLGAVVVQDDFAKFPVARTVVPALLLLLVAGAALWRFESLDLRGDTGVRDRAIRRLEQLEPDALLITGDDAATFGTWYVQTALSVRPDVVTLDVRLFGRPWYDAQLRRRLDVPASVALCDALSRSERPVYVVESNGTLQQNEGGATIGVCRT